MQHNTPTLLAILIAMGMTVQCGAHHPMEHNLGFARRHWMPPLGKCLGHIDPAAAMVDDF
jgi:hypothetical protein